MKNERTFSRPSQILLGSILAACGWTASAQAATQQWQNPTAPGDWGTAANWGPTVPTQIVPTAADIAAIGALSTNPTTPDLNGGTFSVLGLSLAPRRDFVAVDFTIQSTGGTGTLNLGSSGIVMGNGGRATIASSVTLNLTSTQNWGGSASSPNVGTGLTVNGLITGDYKIALNDANNDSTGTFVFANSGSTFSGGFTQVKRTVSVTASSLVSGGLLASGPLGTGTVELQGGTFNLNGNTLHNNILATGNLFLNNAATFSDAGLTTASTFTLGSATNGNVTRIRTNNAAITLDQVIAESGGTGQSIQFASTSTSTPTVAIGRTKTATGNILVGNVNLVLANGAANSGALIGVNGSITATGANKFSSGAIISDTTNLIATDATNFSAISGGKATVYNNARVSFATDQTQATVAGLFTADSQVRLGLSSGALNPTVTQNYDQSAIGNGKAGLVSASTGTVTYNGTLTAGTDNTFRVGGGLGTLALGNALTGSGKSLSVEGGGTVTSTSNNIYDGSTTINNTTLTISGTAGTLSGTSGVTINNSGTLNLTNNTSAVNADRIGSVGITVNNGFFALNGTATTAVNETVGNLTINSGGRNFISIAQTPAATTVKTLQFGTLTRGNNAVAVFRGDTLGGTATARNEIKFSSGPALTGGSGAAGTTTISILPWARGGTGAANAATTFVTYETNGIRALSATTEFVQANNDTTARIDQAIATAGGGSNYNVRAIPNTTGNATLVNTASSSVTVNSLLVDNTATTATATYSLNGSTINVTSGAVHIQHTAAQNLTINTGALAFGSAEGVITNNASSFQLTNLGTQITGTGGLSLYALNGGGIQLSAVTSGTGFSGGLTIGGNGYVGVDQDTRFGNAANAITHAGGELRFFAAFTTTRGLTLLGNVGNNTLGLNSNTGTVNWNGNITGAGFLRLTNNASTPGSNGYSLGGTNDYSGGTQVEGINVTGVTNTALGSGTVTLISANGNAPALLLTGSAPILGGLRGTDGTVTVTPTAATATLTIGSNNENTAFNGVISQGASKTASVTKTGTGTLLLAGNNTYTGATAIDAGTLLVSGSLAGAVNVQTANTGDALLGGTGIVGDVVVKSGGGFTGTVDPGLAANSVGQLSARTLDLQSGAQLRLQLGGVTAGGGALNNDRLNVTATSGTTITLAGQLQGSLINNYAPVAGDLLFVVINNGSSAISGAFSNAAEGASVFFGGQEFQLTYLANFTDTGFYGGSFAGGNDVALLAIPEPNAAISLLGGLGCLVGLQRFRRRKREVRQHG